MIKKKIRKKKDFKTNIIEIVNKIYLGTKINDVANSFIDKTKFNDVANEVKSNKGTPK